MDAWTTIRYLHAQGKGIRAIAEEVGVARNTVRAALREPETPRYQRAARPNPQLTPFGDLIRRFAVEQQLIGSRILRELRAAGYTGGSTALYDYLRDIRKTLTPSRAVERFETAPGQQAQFDWSPYTVELGGQPVKLVVFCLILAYSRRKFYWPSVSENQAAIFEAIEAGYRYFGGVTKELLVDNPRALVTNSHPAHFQWNRRFLELCGHYAVQPVACQPRRPQTKGKVERPFSYLEQQFIKGSTWASFDAFGQALAHFIADDLDVRVHGTTGERPIDRFAGEVDALTPLPAAPFIGSHELPRKVSWDSLISYGGSRYSIPAGFAGTQVWLRPLQGVRLLVRSADGEPIVTLPLAATKGQTILDPAHYAALRRDRPTSKARVTDAFLARFPDHGWFVEEVVAKQRSNAVAHLRGILTLADLYPAERVRAAFALSQHYATYSQTFIRGLLETGVIEPEAGSLPTTIPPDDGRTVGGSNAVTADLGVYQRLLGEVTR